MTLSSLAVLVFFARGENRAGVGVARGIIAPVAATLLLSWMLWQTLAQFNVLLGVEPSSPWRWILPGSYAVAAILGMAWAGILSKAKPDVYAEIGAGAPSVSAAAARGLEPAGISGGR
jgi:hypothetical protein